MYFITTKRMLEVCFSAHPNIQYRTEISLSNPPIFTKKGRKTYGIQTETARTV